VLVVAAAGALRWSAAQDEFWLDEIWSLVAFVRNPHTFRDIFTFHHDNNHYLVTMWMDLVGPHMRNWVWYRVPSIVAGVGTVILAARIALRWGRTAAFCAVLLTTTSFVLILYASEARGYALAGFFSLVAFLALESYLRIPSVGAAACFAAAALLGALSHLTFIQFYAGACAWTVVAMLHDSAPWRQRLLRTVAVHGAPFALLLGLYFLDVRDMRIGGGDDYQLLDVVTRALALAMGCFAAFDEADPAAMQDSHELAATQMQTRDAACRLFARTCLMSLCITRHEAAMAIEHGCHFTIDTDAHATGQLEWLPKGCDRAADTGVPIERVLNSWSADDLLRWGTAR